MALGNYFKKMVHTRVLLIAALGLFLFVVVYVWSATRAVEAPVAEVEVATSTVSGPALGESEPVRLRIPAVRIDTTFEGGMGLNADKTVQVPDSFTEVGWYKYGPTPGELGPAVILGHVDSKDGPAVFWSLGQLEAGDEVLVDRADGSVARFVVTELKRVDQDEFPTREVYGDVEHAGLRIITCSGVYNRGVQRYSHNLIVFAKLAEAQ
jgi:hypothetical protein